MSPFGAPEADEAVGGLMAKHVLHGEFVSMFLWGQAYGGPLETWLAAPIIAIIGPSYLGLRIVPIALSAAAAVVVWRVGLRLMEPHVAAVAGALAWCFPSFLLWKTTHFHIFYASSLLLGMLTLLQALRLREAPSARGVFLLGVLSGVAVWQSFQLVAIVPTVLVWLVVRERRIWRALPWLAGGLAIGLVPVLISNIEHDWWSRDLGHPGETVGYPARVWQFFTNGLPMALDLRTTVTLDWVGGRLVGVALYVLVLAGFVWSWRSRRADPRSDVSVLYAIAVVFPFVYAFSPLTTISFHPGYVVVFMPVIALLLVSWARRASQAVAVSAAAMVVMASSVTTLSVAYAERSDTAPDEFRLLTHYPIPADFDPLVDRLDELGLRRVYADYWVSWRTTFETNERIISAYMRPEALRASPQGYVTAARNPPSAANRHPEYADIVDRVAAPAFVILKGLDPASTDYAALRDAGYKASPVGDLTIYSLGEPSRGVGTPP